MMLDIMLLIVHARSVLTILTELASSLSELQGFKDMLGASHDLPLITWGMPCCFLRFIWLKRSR